MNHLKELELVCSLRSVVAMPEGTLGELRKLESLLLANCIFANLSADDFRNLRNLRNLDLINTKFDNTDWLR